MLTNIFADCAYSYSHGVDKKCLGLIPLYYGLAYSNKSKTIVVLGSGGGIVPMAFRQAQRDLADPASVTYLIDGFVEAAGYGHPMESGGWALEDSVLFKNYPEIRVERKMSKDCRGLVNEIDLLHIDADHSYEGVMLDFDVFGPSLRPHSIITFHDTQDLGVQRAVAEIAERHDYEVLNLRDMASGLSIMRKSTAMGYAKNVFDDCGTRPKGHKWTLGPSDQKTWGSQ